MKILGIHPNVELYGSDRWFASAMMALESALGRERIRVLLPQPGPLTTLPPLDHMETAYRPLMVLRRKGFLRRLLTTVIGAPHMLQLALRDMNAAEGTYINTIVAIDFLIMARFSRRPVVVHVHEIPVGLELQVLRMMLRFANRPVLFNSDAARQAFKLPLSQPSIVVYNGFDDPGDRPRSFYRAGRKLRILQMGRINRWKGQGVLVDACALLPPEIRNRVEIKLVGDTFRGEEDLKEALQERIRRLGVQDVVRILPFTTDQGSCYDNADVVVVPSVLPEPFGRVAIEAMAHRCAVVASGHGGLTEIVVDGETGLLFTPGDPSQLAAAIVRMAQRPEEVRYFGNTGRSRFLSRFRQEVINNVFVSAVVPALGLKLP